MQYIVSVSNVTPNPGLQIISEENMLDLLGFSSAVQGEKALTECHFSLQR